MRKIKNIAIRTMQLGFIEESENILRSLMIAQIEEMGTLHEETIDTIVLLAHNLALLKRWEDLQDLHQYVDETAQECPFHHKALHTANQELEKLLSQELKIVG